MNMSTAQLTSERPRSINTLRGLIKLRWVALVGQALTLLIVKYTWDASLPMTELLTLLAILALSNIALMRLTHRVIQVGAVILLDVALLTSALALSGGPSNPFSVLYLVLVTLGAIMTNPRWTSLIAIASSLGFGLLFYKHHPLPPELGGHHGAHHAGSFNAHLQGMWIAYSVAAFSIGAFVSQLSVALRRQRERQDQTARLLGLAALAAGAAHEIGNPLGTIKIAAEELELELSEAQAEAHLIGDARLINDEVERARDVLNRLAIAAGELTGEPLTPLDVHALLEETRSTLGDDSALVSIETSDKLGLVSWPRQATTQALSQLIRNALQSESDRVAVTCEPAHEPSEPKRSGLMIRVIDEGRGMSQRELDALGEPFFTTRPQTGMGLGVFIARSLIERMGGQMSVRSRVGQGTTISIWLPREVDRAEQAKLKRAREGTTHA